MTDCTSQDVSISAEWQHTQPKVTHQAEYMVCCGLNKYLYDSDLKVERVSNNPFSSYDLKVISFDYNTLVEGPIICKIDVERKSTRFPDGGYPKNWKRGVSFAYRKLTKSINSQTDVYLLVDNDTAHPRIIWASYGTIKEHGDYESFKGNKNEFKVIREHHADKLNYSFKSLADWCTFLKNQFFDFA